MSTRADDTIHAAPRRQLSGGTMRWLLVALGVVLLQVSAWAAAPPAVVWTSTPVRPGEAVMVYGGPWTDACTVSIDGPDTRTVRPISVSPDCVTFIYPEDWPLAAFRVDLREPTGQATTQVNAPTVWWLQGDRGHSASPNGWLRVFGRCIGFADASVTLRQGEKSWRLAPDSADEYAMQVALPQSLAPGEYQVAVDNGLAEVAAGSIHVVAHAAWPDRVVDISDYGAIANDHQDDTPAILAALQALTEDGGGVLYVPRGRFGMIGELKLPPHTLLRGAGMGLSQIYWPDVDHPTAPLISGTHHFGIEDIFLAAGNFDDGIIARPPGPDDDWVNEEILIQRVRIRFLHTDTISGEESLRRAMGGTAVSIQGRGVRILECDWITSKGATRLHADYLEFRGNRIQGSGNNQSLWLYGRNAIIEDNNFQGSSCSLSNGSQRMYIHGNAFGGIYGEGDRETFTFDSGHATYNDTPAAIGPASVTLAPGVWRDQPTRWIGESVAVIGGSGAGQLRTITAIDGRRAILDRPWDVLPDTESHVVVSLVRSHLLLIENDVRDGNPFQLYGGAVDVVLARNQFTRCSGAHAFGMTKGGVPEPSWYIQFLGNEILEGNSLRGPWSFVVPAADSYLGFFDRGAPKPMTFPLARVGVMRRNVLHSNAFIYGGPKVRNLLVENNLVKQADQGLVIRTPDAIVRGNRFENVTHPNGKPQQPDPPVVPVTHFLVAGPFANRSGERIDTAIHPPERYLDLSASYDTTLGDRPWTPASPTNGKLDLTQVFGDVTMVTAHAVAVVHAEAPVRVVVDYGSNTHTLCMVNGERIGSSLRRPGPATVTLHKGDNRIDLISSHAAGAWTLPLKLTVIDRIPATDLRVLTPDELRQSAALRPKSTPPATGTDLPDSLGVDWQLVLWDNFDRTRVDPQWQVHMMVPSYRKSGLMIHDGGLRSHGGLAVMTWPTSITAPFRVEFDVWMDEPRRNYGVLFGETRTTRFMTDPDRRHGYFFSGLGIGNCALSRNNQVLDVRGGALVVAEPRKWHHVVFQITPPRCQFIFDGNVRVDVQDPEFQAGLEELALWFDTEVAIDNLRIYTGEVDEERQMLEALESTLDGP